MQKLPAISQEALSAAKEEFNALLRQTKREGIESLITWLESETDFYTAPASTKHHGAYWGGLLVHSLDVYKLLQNFTKNKNIPQDSLIIAGLLHDVCKVNFFTTTVRNKKLPNEKAWEEIESYAIEDQFPFGHGEKSVYLLMKHIRLTDEEAVAIRWHMGGFDDAARSYAGGLTQAAAYRQYSLAPALSIADMYAAHLLDRS